MPAFEFYTSSEEEQAQLRGDPRRCVELLRACKRLADRLAGTSGIYTPLDAVDEGLLQGFHLVQQAYEGYEHEGAFDLLCQCAGLRHSDAGLLSGRVQTLFAEREPVRFDAESYMIIHQWLRNQERDQGPEKGTHN
jgi:hypothetical protein